MLTVGNVEIVGVAAFKKTSVVLLGAPLFAPFELYVIVLVHFAYKVVSPVDAYMVNPDA